MLIVFLVSFGRVSICFEEIGKMIVAIKNGANGPQKRTLNTYLCVCLGVYVNGLREREIRNQFGIVCISRLGVVVNGFLLDRFICLEEVLGKQRPREL